MSTQRSISGIMNSRGSIRHNNRDFYAQNVRQELSKNNITLCRENIYEAYHKLFDEALSAYNAKQKRKDRVIPDYYEHINRSNQEYLYYEAIFQIGNKDDTAVGTAEGDTAAVILEEFYKKFEENNPHIHVINAVIHMDEATPHLHIDFIPVATESKRGLSTRNSLSKALEQQGFKSEGKFNTCSRQWMMKEKERLAECMAEHGFEHIVLGNNKSNLSVEEFKLQKRMEEVAAMDEKIEERKQELSQLTEQVESKEDELQHLTENETAIHNISEIKAKKTHIGDNVKIKSSDYDALVGTAKRYYAHKSSEALLSAQIELVKRENSELKETISEQKNTISRFESTIFALRRELSELKAYVNKLLRFIDKFKLRDRLEEFMHPNKHRQKYTER